MAQLTVDLVTKNGSVDVEASTEAFQAALSSYIVDRETEQSVIAQTVAAQFEKHPGKAIAMPVLASMTLAALNVQPENYSSLETRALDYVRENASDKREDGKLYRIGKGKGGGVKRWTDIPVEEPKTSKTHK